MVDVPGKRMRICCVPPAIRKDIIALRNVDVVVCMAGPAYISGNRSALCASTLSWHGQYFSARMRFLESSSVCMAIKASELRVPCRPLTRPIQEGRRFAGVAGIARQRCTPTEGIRRFAGRLDAPGFRWRRNRRGAGGRAENRCAYSQRENPLRGTAPAATNHRYSSSHALKVIPCCTANAPRNHAPEQPSV